MRLIVLAGIVAGAVVAPVACALAGPRADETTCLEVSGDAGNACLKSYVRAIEHCRRAPDAACETAVRADGGALDEALGDAASPVMRRCADASVERLGYLDLDDLAFRIPEACADSAGDPS